MTTSLLKRFNIPSFPSHPLGPFGGDRYEEPELQVPDIWDLVNIPVPGKYDPVMMLLTGRRGKGKTLAMTVLGDIMKRRYHKSGHHEFQVWANYRTDFADYVNPFIVDQLMEFPSWGRNGLLLIDEIATVVPSRRSISRVNVDLNAFLTQIRKRNIEIIATTQFPTTLDKDTLRQIDFFVRCDLAFRGKVVELSIWDWWGQWTGKDYVKQWPPVQGTEDYWLPLVDTDRYFGTYDTEEVVAPIWKDKAVRLRMLKEQGYEFEELPSEEQQAPTRDIHGKVVGEDDRRSELTDASTR